MKQVVISSLLCSTLLLSFAQSQAQETTGTQGMAHSMSRSFDPQVYSNLMNQMMSNPMGIMTNPMSTCAQCHSGEDVARYSTTMGPMMQMMNPANWMNPNAYTQMMTAPMDPASYTKWYEGWMQKYGAMFGQPEPAAGE